MRALVALLLLLWAASARAADAIVLISPESAGPPLDASLYPHGEWVLWAAEDSPGSGNRLLSVLTGLDWSGTGHDLIFKDGALPVSSSFADLQRMGYFVARERVVSGKSVALRAGAGPVSPQAMLLALDGSSPEIRLATLRDSLPEGWLACAQADSWDTVAAIGAKCGGRVLVVEYPPPPGRLWSRLWLQGKGWPKGLPVLHALGVPGLIPASAAGQLLLHPDRFDWIENDAGNWGGAHRWLSFITYESPLVLAILGFALAFFSGCIVYLVSREESARLASGLVKALLLGPASLFLAGEMSRHWGADLFALWVLLAFIGLWAAAMVLGSTLVRAFPETHPLLGIALAGFAACSASRPLWSVYSNVLGGVITPIPSDAVGIWFSYLVGICAFSHPSRKGAWIGRILAALAFLWSFAPGVWWVAGKYPFMLLPPLALLIGEKLFRAWMLPLLGLVPLADGKLLHYGFVWAPANLYHSLRESRGINLASHFGAIASPALLGSALIGGAMAVFVERYFFQHVRRIWVRDSSDRALFQAAAACAALGVLQPLMLPVAITCLLAGTLVLLTDAARPV